jgi:signal transduction histidine kinase/DNA-binding response OmpR family regulator/HAMP domain-containing protein
MPARFALRARMNAIVAIAALALVILMVVGWFTAKQTEEHLTSIRDQYLPKIALRPVLERQFERLQRGLQDAVAASDPDLLAQTRELERSLQDELAAAAAALDPRATADLRRAFESYYQTAYRISERLIAGETGENIVDEMAAMQAQQAEATELLGSATAFDQVGLSRAFDDAARAQQASTQIRFVVSGLCVLLVILLSLGISRSVLRSVASLTAGFERFGDGDFSPIPDSSRDELGDVARQANLMAGRLERLSVERDRIDWLKSGQAGLADQLRGELEPGEAAERATGFLARYLGAPVGAIYYGDRDGAFRRLAGYAVADDPGTPAPVFRPGEGVVGQAALSIDVTVMKVPPESHLRLRSALAEGPPRALVLVPLVHLGRVTGVLELAFLDDWSEENLELLLGVRESIAIALEVAHGRGALRQKNAELARASTYKSQFLANMSHELRTPLNAILGFAELLHDGAVSPDAPEHQEFLRDILTSGRHLLQLINDVLDLSKVEAGKLEFRPEEVRLEPLIGEVLAILRTTAAEKQIRIASQVAPEIDRALLDPARLKQVLYNYVSNALKFTPERGQVTIRASAEGDSWFRLEVEDTGIGIAAADLDRLFGEFQQLEGGAARRQGGTGLGLALTRRLVEAQGGRVGVTSVPGAGSTFSAVLPRRSGVASALAAPLQLLDRPGAPSILVVEDSAADQRLLADALARAGYRVEIAATGAQALARCRERVFDAITLDLLLPDMSGVEVLEKIREGGKNREVPVVVVTVVAERGAVAGFAVSDILPKPIDQQALLDALVRAGVTPHRAGSVLVVDDDPGSRRLMSATLDRLGYRYRCEPDGESGLRAAAESPPRAVVLDLVMPGMSGFEFLERFRREPHGRLVPVLIWTVKDLGESELERLRSSAQAVVSKGEGGSGSVLAELAALLRQAEG